MKNYQECDNLVTLFVVITFKVIDYHFDELPALWAWIVKNYQEQSRTVEKNSQEQLKLVLVRACFSELLLKWWLMCYQGWTHRCDHFKVSNLKVVSYLWGNLGVSWGVSTVIDVRLLNIDELLMKSMPWEPCPRQHRQEL